MSIINEALKKVQNDLIKSKETAAPETPVEPSTITAAVARQPEPPPPPSDIQKAIQQEAPAVAEKPVIKAPTPAPAIFSKFLNNKPKATVVKPKPAASPDKARKERMLTIVSALLCIVLLICIGVLLNQFLKIHGPKGIINGIMAEEGKNVVLIDNEIYEVGDTYQGAKIVAIDIDKVQFLEKGIVRTVKVKNKNPRLKK